jgi:hypothetical protein
MSFSRPIFALLILLVLLVSFFSSEAFGVDGEKVVTSDIERAEDAMISAYEAVSDAEHAGANVSGLLTRLNDAGEYLANANIWYGLKNLDNATRFSNLCYDVAEEVRNEAYELENKAFGLRSTCLVLTTIGSFIAVIIIVFVSLFGWRAFKRRYQKRVLEMKPEVVYAET